MASTRGGSVTVPESFDLGDEDVAKLTEEVKKIKKMPKKDTGKGVIYLGHIPRGFYEPQMKAFFSQFGIVTRIRLSRSKRTGNSKGYAFIEFQYHEIAKVVADTMNNYLMFMRLLKCELLPSEKVHPDMFKGGNKRFSIPKAAKVSADRHNSEKNTKKEKKARGRQMNKLKKLAELGIQFDLKKVEVSDQSPMPEAVNTPGGMLQVLKEDASDMEVTFRTPPGAIKSSRLAATPRITIPRITTPRIKKRTKRLK